MSFNLFMVGDSGYLQNQKLPAALPLTKGGFLNAGIDLIFEDAQHRERTVMFRSNLDVAQVPAQAAGWLFGAALTGLLGAAHKKVLR